MKSNTAVRAAWHHGSRGKAAPGVFWDKSKRTEEQGSPVGDPHGRNISAAPSTLSRSQPTPNIASSGVSCCADLEKTIEYGKKAIAGTELHGQTLGIVGLGKVGCLVADAAIKLGMQVLGYDPEITVDAAWSLPAQVKRANSVEEVLRGSQFTSLHVPLVAGTRGLVGPANIAALRPGAVLLNFIRDGVVDTPALLQALNDNKLGGYVCDFPSAALHAHPRVVALPHLGASTREAEDNCAVMVAVQLRDYLEDGQINHAVNFPAVYMARESPWRVGIANANVPNMPNMLGQISTTMAVAGLNIHNMVNKSRGEIAYTLVDVESAVGPEVLAALVAIPGVLAVRYLPKAPPAKARGWPGPLRPAW